MSKTVTAGIVVAVVGAVALWFLGRDDPRAGLDEAARPSRIASPSDRPADADLVGAGAPASGAQAALAGSTAPAGTRTAASVESPLPAGEGFAVRLVRADDRSPVADAEVFAFAGKVPEADAEEARDLARLDAWIAKHGLRLRSNALGLVNVPADPADTTLVVARTADLWGRAWVRAPEPDPDEPGAADAEPQEVELRVDAGLSVVVVDEQGAPAGGVGVQLRREHDAGWSTRLAGATTAGDGTARLAHVQTYRQRSLDAERWSVRLDAVSTELIEQALDADALPTEPVRLVLPTTGKVVVELLDAFGKPWLGEALVTIGAIRAGESREISPFAQSTRPTLERKPENGVAVFRHVALGLDLAVDAHRQRSGLKTHAYAPGPRAKDEEVRVPLTFGTENPVVVVRVLGLEGAPVVDTELTVAIDISSSFMINVTDLHPRSDADGRVRIDIQGGYSDGAKRTARILLGDEANPEASAALDLARDFPIGVTDLGDVFLRTPGVFVRGRVVDEVGAGVAGAELALERNRSESWWEDVWSFSAKSAEDGTFDVRKPVDGERFRLHAKKAGLAGHRVEFQRGADVLLRLSTEGSISGSVIADEGVPLTELSVSARPNDAKEWSGNRGNDQLSEDGTFRLPELIGGSYTVELTDRTSALTLLTVPDVIVVSGRDTADPRLQRVDLRGRLRAIRLTLVRPDGRKELQGDYKHGPAGADELDRWGWFSGTEVVILTTDEAIDVDLTPRGFQPVELRDLRGDRTIELSEGMTVRVRLSRGVTLPEPPFYLHPALSPADTDEWSIDWSTPAFDETREVGVKGVKPGRVKLSWIVERREGGSAMAMMAPADPEQFFEILPGIDGQVFDVTLTAEALADVLEALAF